MGVLGKHVVGKYEGNGWQYMRYGRTSQSDSLLRCYEVVFRTVSPYNNAQEPERVGVG